MAEQTQKEKAKGGKRRFVPLTPEDLILASLRRVDGVPLEAEEVGSEGKKIANRGDLYHAGVILQPFLYWSVNDAYPSLTPRRYRVGR